MDIRGASTIVIDGGMLSDEGRGFATATVDARMDSVVNLRSGDVRGKTGLYLHDSRLLQSGGSITGTAPLGDSVGIALVARSFANLDGGVIRGGSGDANSIGIAATGQSQVFLNGAQVTSDSQDYDATTIDLRDQSQLSMTGGSIDVDGLMAANSLTNVHLRDEAKAVIHSGSAILKMPCESAGTHRVVRTDGNASADWVRGTIELQRDASCPVKTGQSELFVASGTSEITIRGGLFHVASSEFHRDLTVNDNATMTIYGERFNYPLMQPITDETGTISGTLSDGTAIAWSFARAPGATIYLVPEPAAISMFAAAMLGYLIVEQNHRKCS